VIEGLTVDISYNNLLGLMQVSPADVQRVMQEATREVAMRAKVRWAELAVEKLKTRSAGAYIQGIKDAEVKQVGGEGGVGVAGVSYIITNHAPHASFVEDGRAAFHLPSRINWSGPKVKQGKNGPYLSIPFEHAAFAPEKALDKAGIKHATRRRMMPRDISNAAFNLTPRTRLNAGPQRNAQGQYTAADRYTQGGSLRGMPTSRFIATRDGLVENRRGEQMIAGRIGGRQVSNPAWQSSRFEGLFKTGAPGHTKYMTIRTITPNSKGWNIPSQPGYGIARQVAAEMQNEGHRDLNDAIADGLYALGIEVDP
jgi:hypothetical protein